MKPQNYVPSAATRLSYCLTADTIVTYEQMVDCDERHKDFCVAALKFWDRDTLQVTQMANNPDRNTLLWTISN